MGRGRAKAKQTRVARDLKYHSPNIDLDRLRADLGGAPDDDLDGEAEATAGSGGWADLYEQDDEEDEARASSY
ncbi:MULTISPECIES: DUF3073 family protein [Pseudofrankia]|uniref:DUF3073 family protein n=1 Tax=Pseudofrankia TaxID=2994363 RepID=UPI000234C233|nr:MULTISPECIES: DUF3073 family protein [Pseudofrankia]OHV31228.1 hypothetical protein BCD49_32390 [Pseudofrankia sp. EUN1h]